MRREHISNIFQQVKQKMLNAVRLGLAAVPGSVLHEVRFQECGAEEEPKILSNILLLFS